MTQFDGAAEPFGVAPSQAAPSSPPGVPVAGMEAVMAVRFEQIERFGHTLESDRAKRLDELATPIFRYTHALREDVLCHAHRDAKILHATKAAAALVALLDRLLAEKAEDDEK